MSTRRPFIGGNWKMNTTSAGAAALAGGTAAAFKALENIDAAIFPPFPYLLTAGEALRQGRSPVMLGAQDAYHEPDGAFTGEVSLAMLKDCGVRCVLVGHSERRHVLGESDELINKKTRAVLASGLVCVLCVGETLTQRQTGRADAVNESQIRSALRDVPASQTANLVIAYEPVWAIGTGVTATPADAQSAHKAIRLLLATLFDARVAQQTRIIYGGSVKPSNAGELFAQEDIDGALVGGASLKAEDLAAIARACG